MNFDNLNIHKFDLLLESTLLNYVKYPKNLSLGNELNRGQSLISSNSIYRLSLEDDGRLILYLDPTRRKHLFLFKEVESMWFYDLALMVVLTKSSTGLSESKPFPDPKIADAIGEFLSRLGSKKKPIKLRLKNDGTIQISTRSSEVILVIQFRDDVKAMWNSSEPKFESVCFFSKNTNLENSEEDNDSSEDESSSEDSDTENDSLHE